MKSFALLTFRKLVLRIRMKPRVVCLVCGLVSSLSQGAVFDYSAPLQNVTASFAGSTVSYQVYDPVRGAWMGSSYNAGAATYDLKTAQGVVAWSTGPTVYYAIYDPVAGLWKLSGTASGGSVFDLSNTNGAVAWSRLSTIYART